MSAPDGKFLYLLLGATDPAEDLAVRATRVRLGGPMSAVIDLWQAIVAVMAGVDTFTLGLIVLKAAAAGFALERVPSFAGVTLAALLGLALAKFALALSLHRTEPIASVADDLWHDFATMPMLTFTAYAVIVAGLIAAVAGVRAALRRV